MVDTSFLALLLMIFVVDVINLACPHNILQQFHWVAQLAEQRHLIV